MSSEFPHWADPRFINLFVVADIVNQPIHIITPDGIIRFVNQAWCLTYQINREQAIGQHIENTIKIDGYYLAATGGGIADPLNLTYEHLKEPTQRSVALLALERQEQVSMFSQTPSFNKVVVTATPIFNDQHEIICVFTLIQNLTMLSCWRDYLENEMQNNLLLQQEVQYLRNSQMESKFVGNSKVTVNLRKMISAVATSDASVLISGESGVGKEVVAKEIHRESSHRDMPFIAVNCAAIPESLLESELFGHEKGAFTGAVSTKIGLFEMANNGTIFLDEIGEFPLHLQPKLLRVLQEREFRRVGGTKKIPINIRVISATNRDLLSRTKTGDFRLDLYYRLNVFSLQIPSLRQRKEDIAILASFFLRDFNRKYHKAKFFTEQALVALEQYSWPGNVRELENAVERIVVIGDQPAVTIKHVHTAMGSDDLVSETSHGTLTLKEAVTNLEREMITDALRTYKTTYKAAEALGSTQPTIARKAKLLGITDW